MIARQFDIIYHVVCYPRLASFPPINNMCNLLTLKEYWNEYFVSLPMNNDTQYFYLIKLVIKERSPFCNVNNYY